MSVRTKLGFCTIGMGLSGLLFLVQLTTPSVAFAADDYERAVEGDLAVRGKLMPKKNTFELNADGGLILNQSYINTYLLHGTANYYFSEVWGLGIEGAFGINSDKGERDCIESFYNNPKELPWESCPASGETPDPPPGGNVGPAYVPIREINTIIVGNALWSPVYGKLLVLLRAHLHFDLFFSFGGGVALSSYYPKSELTRTDGSGRGRPTRKPADPQAPGTTAQELGIGCEVADDLCYGVEGRPDPLSETHPVINIGIGQRLLFTKNLSLKVELRDLLLIGTDSGFDNLFALWGGIGLRL